LEGNTACAKSGLNIARHFKEIRVFAVHFIDKDSGDIAVALPKDADVVLELSIEDEGDIDVDVNLPHEVLEEREGYMKVQLGAGSRTLKVYTHSADIEVREAEEK
jgi:hypothetical protein